MLRFRLGPFPVAIEPWFWISAVLLTGMGGSIISLAIWVAVVFVSVLVHELGHAGVALALGGRPQVVLRAFGGVTMPGLRNKPSAIAEIILSIAGPLAGLSLWLVAYGLAAGLHPAPGSPLGIAVVQLAYTSKWWAVLNLLPVLDLDGGHVLQAAISGIRKNPSRRPAAAISAVIAALVAAWAYFGMGDAFIAIFFALFLFKNVAELRAGGARALAADEESPAQQSAAEVADVDRLTEVARASMAAGDAPSALAAAELLESSEGQFRPAAGLRIRAGVFLSQGRLVDAGLLAGRSFTLVPQPDAAVVAARANLRMGEMDAARAWIRRAIEAGAPAEAVKRDAELGPLVS